MSHEEQSMVELWLQSNQVTREANKVDSPKVRGIILNRGINKRERKYRDRSVENFGKYIERNF